MNGDVVHNMSQVLYPLLAAPESVCEEGGGTCEADVVMARDLPQPYRMLLDHDRDMTGTLEAFFDQEITLRVCAKQLVDDALWRQVVLVGKHDGRAAEFGAIRITLSCFEGKTREMIEQCKIPLGRILREQAIDYVSNPSAFLRVVPDEAMRDCLGIGGRNDDIPGKRAKGKVGEVGGGVLYGRRNTLTMSDGRIMAQIIEILPVIDSVNGSTVPDVGDGMPGGRVQGGQGDTQELGGGA